MRRGLSTPAGSNCALSRWCRPSSAGGSGWNTPADLSAARNMVADAVRRGTITLEGGVRQVPTDLDFSKTTAWERSMRAINTYQNGGYWHTASGWLIEALWKTDRPLALQVFREMLAHLRAQDFRKGPGYGAPWEVYGPNGQARQNGVYMTSVALPYGILKRLQASSVTCKDCLCQIPCGHH